MKTVVNFDGTSNHVVMFDRALSEEELNLLYNSAIDGVISVCKDCGNFSDKGHECYQVDLV